MSIKYFVHQELTHLIDTLFHSRTPISVLTVLNGTVSSGVQNTLGSGKNLQGGSGRFRPRNAKKSPWEEKKSPESCHRLQCTSLFNVADLVNGMWKVAPQNKIKIFGLPWLCERQGSAGPRLVISTCCLPWYTHSHVLNIYYSTIWLPFLFLPVLIGTVSSEHSWLCQRQLQLVKPAPTHSQSCIRVYYSLAGLPFLFLPALNGTVSSEHSWLCQRQASTGPGLVVVCPNTLTIMH